MLPGGCVALGWSLSSLTFHFLTGLLGDLKTEMMSMSFADFGRDVGNFWITKPKLSSLYSKGISILDICFTHSRSITFST